jgi:hypothetical protein
MKESFGVYQTVQSFLLEAIKFSRKMKTIPTPCASPKVPFPHARSQDPHQRRSRHSHTGGGKLSGIRSRNIFSRVGIITSTNWPSTGLATRGLDSVNLCRWEDVLMLKPTNFGPTQIEDVEVHRGSQHGRRALRSRRLLLCAPEPTQAGEQRSKLVGYGV